MISETERKFTEALMLAIMAPTEKLSNECLAMAESIGSDLTDREKELSQLGIEVAISWDSISIEALRSVKK